VFCGGAERTLRDKGRVGPALLNSLIYTGFTLLNDLYLYGKKLNRDKNKKEQAIEKVIFLSLPFFCSQAIF
jgi:hypothetical protein